MHNIMICSVHYFTYVVFNPQATFLLIHNLWIYHNRLHQIRLHHMVQAYISQYNIILPRWTCLQLTLMFFFSPKVHMSGHNNGNLTTTGSREVLYIATLAYRKLWYLCMGGLVYSIIIWIRQTPMDWYHWMIMNGVSIIHYTNESSLSQTELDKTYSTY